MIDDRASKTQRIGEKTSRTYMPTLPLNEAREMLQKWGEEIEKIVSGAVGAQGQGL